MKLKKIGEVWNSANRLLKGVIGLLSSKNFATMATGRNDFPSLLMVDKLWRWSLIYSNQLHFFRGTGQSPLIESQRDDGGQERVICYIIIAGHEWRTVDSFRFWDEEE